MAFDFPSECAQGISAVRHPLIPQQCAHSVVHIYILWKHQLGARPVSCRMPLDLPHELGRMDGLELSPELWLRLPFGLLTLAKLNHRVAVHFHCSTKTCSIATPFVCSAVDLKGPSLSDSDSDLVLAWGLHWVGMMAMVAELWTVCRLVFAQSLLLARAN